MIRENVGGILRTFSRPANMVFAIEAKIQPLSKRLLLARTLRLSHHIVEMDSTIVISWTSLKVRSLELFGVKQKEQKKKWNVPSSTSNPTNQPNPS